MSKFKDPAFRKQLSTIFIKIAEKIEQDEQFAKYVFEETNLPIENYHGEKKKVNINESLPNMVNKDPLPDIFTIYLHDGAQALREKLNNYGNEILKEIVLENGLDPARKVRRWKSNDKIVSFIIEVVSKQMSKGKAFLQN